MKKMILISAFCVLSLLTGVSPEALAESASSQNQGDSEMRAVARLKLRVVIPRFLYFQVGAAGRSVEAVSFEPAAESVGDGVAVAATAAGGATRVALRSNYDRAAVRARAG